MYKKNPRHSVASGILFDMIKLRIGAEVRNEALRLSAPLLDKRIGYADTLSVGYKL